MLRNNLMRFLEIVYNFQKKFFSFITEKLSKIKINKTSFFIFLSIFITQYFFCSVVCMYFDDFGNASLSYAYETPNVNGTDYTIAQIFEWAKVIYNNWGGRLLYAIVFVIPLLKNGITAYMFCQSIVVTFLIYYMYKIITLFSKNQKGNCFIPITLTALYLLIGMEYIRHGIFWASASVLYVWPMLPFMAFIYYYIRAVNNIEEGKKNKLPFILLILVLAFFASFAQEQITPGIIAFLIIFIIFNHIKNIKKYLYLDIPVFLVVIISFLILFIAPGNWNRMDTNVEFAGLSFFGKILTNYPKIISAIFIASMKKYMYILTGIMFYLIFDIVFQNYVKKGKKISLLLLLIPIILIANYVIVIKFKYNEQIKLISLSIFGTLWLISMLIVSIIYFISKNILSAISFEFSAVCTIFCLLISPVVGERTSLPFIFCLFLVIGLLLNSLLENKNYLKPYLYILVAILLFFGVKNSITNYNGYKENYAIHQLNFNLLKNYSAQNGNQITLYKIPKSEYSAFMPYEFPGIDYWMKQYFNIPNDVIFNWVDIFEPLR